MMTASEPRNIDINLALETFFGRSGGSEIKLDGESRIEKEYGASAPAALKLINEYIDRVLAFPFDPKDGNLGLQYQPHLLPLV